MKKIKAFLVFLLATVCVLPFFASCESGAGSAPALEDVKADFEALINASFEINDIFYGPGLPVYDREESSGSGDALYDEDQRMYYWFIEDKDLGTVLKIYPLESKHYFYFQDTGRTIEVSFSGFSPLGVENPYLNYSEDGKTARMFKLIENYTEEMREIVYDENSPAYYDYVRLDCKFQRVDDIKKLAESVYSEAYLSAIYTTMFDGIIEEGRIVYARYMADESGNTTFLLKSNQFKPFFETQTTYDLSSMKIINPSTANLVNIQIEAVGRYIDKESGEIVTGPLTKNLRFVKNAEGKWRLDTPTY